MNGMNELQIIGPKQAGLLDQFWTLGWKFCSKRFGPFGCAYQMKDEHDVRVRPRVQREGGSLHRRLEGKNGWLWRTIMRRDGKIYKLKREMAELHIKIPDKPRWYEKIGMFLMGR